MVTAPPSTLARSGPQGAQRPGEPVVFGPARRNRALHIALCILVGLIAASALVWLVGTRSGTVPWSMPCPGALDKGESLALLLATLCLVASILCARWQAPCAIITVGDDGVEIRLHRYGQHTATFVPHVLLQTIDLVPIQGGEKVLTIRALPGAQRRWCQIRCREATGADALDIVREIVSRARAAGVAVSGPAMRGMLGLESVWTFGTEESSLP